MQPENSHAAEVRRSVERLIENGSHFNVDELERIYHPELKIVKIDEHGQVEVIDRAANLAFFRSMRDRNAPPLSRDAEFNYVEGGERSGHVLVTRKMQLADRPEKLVFSIHLVREQGRWQVIRETAFVQPLESSSGV